MELVVIVMSASPDTGTTDQCSRSRISTWNRKYPAHKIKIFGSWKKKNLLCLSVRGLSKKILWVSPPRAKLYCNVISSLGNKNIFIKFHKGVSQSSLCMFPRYFSWSPPNNTIWDDVIFDGMVWNWSLHRACNFYFTNRQQTFWKIFPFKQTNQLRLLWGQRRLRIMDG